MFASVDVVSRCCHTNRFDILSRSSINWSCLMEWEVYSICPAFSIWNKFHPLDIVDDRRILSSSPFSGHSTSSSEFNCVCEEERKLSVWARENLFFASQWSYYLKIICGRPNKYKKILSTRLTVVWDHTQRQNEKGKTEQIFIRLCDRIVDIGLCFSFSFSLNCSRFFSSGPTEKNVIYDINNARAFWLSPGISIIILSAENTAQKSVIYFTLIFL